MSINHRLPIIENQAFQAMQKGKGGRIQHYIIKEPYRETQSSVSSN